MIVRIALVGWIWALIGCGGEPERSRVVPSAGAGKNSDFPASHPTPGEIRKIEMH